MTSKQQQDMGEATPLRRSTGPEGETFEARWIAFWQPVGRGFATFLAPLVALWLVIKAFWILLPSEWFETRTLSTLDTSALKLKGFAYGIDGSMNFSIMSAAIWGAGLVAVVLSFVVLRRTLPRGRTVAVLMGAAAVGCLVGLWESNPVGTKCESSDRAATVHVDKNKGFRSVVIDNVICVAERSQSPNAPVLEKTQYMIIANTFVGFIGAATVMAAFGVLAVRRGNWTDVARLRQRL